MIKTIVIIEKTVKLIYSKLSPVFKKETGSLKVKGDRYFNFFKRLSFEKEEIKVNMYKGRGISKAISDFELCFIKQARAKPRP